MSLNYFKKMKKKRLLVGSNVYTFNVCHDKLINISKYISN